MPHNQPTGRLPRPSVVWLLRMGQTRSQRVDCTLHPRCDSITPSAVQHLLTGTIHSWNKQTSMYHMNWMSSLWSKSHWRTRNGRRTLILKNLNLNYDSWKSSEFLALDLGICLTLSFSVSLFMTTTVLKGKAIILTINLFIQWLRPVNLRITGMGHCSFSRLQLLPKLRVRVPPMFSILSLQVISCTIFVMIFPVKRTLSILRTIILLPTQPNLSVKLLFYLGSSL